ncbi:MAG: helix-turn-helix domain-containing protein [Ilumatobacteraceae bacterium]|nr:TetR/AcrR family transcriptional regulator [Acidimicrobiales bacterium]MCB9393383.1 TetR/AcrR family transcriptional regulator [Acidimicrobiaceae bacterium]
MTVATEQVVPTRGHKKKARTRQLLLDTAMEVLAEQGEGFSVADIAARAGVSHGTFYNYFTDRDQLVAALVPHLVETFAARSAAEVDDPDPAARFALITARGLARAVAAPDTLRVALRIEALQRAVLVEGPLSYLRADLRAGHAAGRFTDRADDGTLDVVIGSLVLAARRIVDGETRPAYRRSVIRTLLRGLGLDDTEAAELASRAVAAARP